MAQPAARQHTAPANADPNAAFLSSSGQPVVPSTSWQRDRRSLSRHAEADGSARAKHRRKSSLKNAKNSTETLRARLKEDAARKRLPADARLGGRQWAVSNIGHNGRLYLRPVVRPGHERIQPLASPFANAQPRRSLLISEALKARKGRSSLGLESFRSRPETPPTPPQARAIEPSGDCRRSADHSPPQAGSIQRSHSFSTVDDEVFTRNEAPGAFKVVLSRARSHRDRPKRNKSEDTDRLGISIPSQHLGEPQFGQRGTPILRSSSQATDGPQYSESTKSGHTSLIHAPQAPSVPSASRRHSEMSHTPAFVFRPSTSHSALVDSNPQLRAYIRERDFWAHAFAFDHLEAHPVDPALIIYTDFRGPKKRKIVYATPLTLVAQITSSTNVDYDLLSDFFMTFRQFMPKKKLLEFLHDRFLWAIARQGDVSTAVRVRTFVAMRHWILNYMVEDFVPDYSLRADFCTMVNGLYEYLREIGATGPKGLEQIAELKRCWRQYISLYFEAPYDEYASAHDSIQAGGHLSLAAESLDTTLPSPQVQRSPIEVDSAASKDHTRQMGDSVRLLRSAQGSKYGQYPLGSRNIGGTDASGPRQVKLTQAQASSQDVQNSQKSSMIWSCSIPFRPPHLDAHRTDAALNKQAAPRTVALPSHLSNPTRVNKPKQMQQGTSAHTQAMGDRSPATQAMTKTHDQPISSEPTRAPSPSPTVSGDLIKGLTLLPYAPEIEYQKEELRFDVSDDSDRANKGPGVRRMIGSIRRAVSNSKQTQGPALRHAHLERHGDSLSTVAVIKDTPVPSSAAATGAQPAQLPKRERVLGPLQSRTDLLTGRSMESYNKAFAATKPEAPTVPQVHEPLRSPKQGLTERTLPHLDQQSVAVQAPTKREQSTANVTVGSRSIVIGHEGLQSSSSEANNSDATPGLLPMPDIVRTDFDDSVSDMAGFQAPLDDDEPIEAASDDGWHAEGSEWDSQGTSTGLAAPSPLSIPQNKPQAISISGAYLAEEPRAKPGHQPSNSLDDPVLPEDPQPSHSLRRRNDRSNLRAAIPSFHERLAKADKPLPDALHSHPPSRPSSHVSLIPASDLPPSPAPAPGVLGPTVEEQLKSMLFPDDPNEDGSPAAALLKLEGIVVDAPRTRTSFDLDLASEDQQHQDAQDKFRHRHEHVMDAYAPIHEPPASAVLSASPAVSSKRYAHRHNVSEVSYNSIPLLERGLTNRATPRRRSHSGIRGSDSSDSVSGFQFPARGGRLRATNPDDTSEDYASEATERPEGSRGLALEEIMGRSLVVETDSRYLEDAGHYSSGERAEPFEARHGMRSFFGDEVVGVDDATSEAIFHPLRHPSTPPSTADGSRDAHGVRMSNGLPTPANSPSSRLPPKPSFSAGVYMPTGVAGDKQEPKHRPQPSIAPPRHSAFILRFRAENIARAMTLVEQSALAQINWRELIELSWSKSGLEKVRNWSEFIMPPTSMRPRSVKSNQFLRSLKTVDVVIARFNVVVKWAISEILLTDDIFGRVHCIQQLIRVALACRKLRNFATTYQIATALVSVDLAGLRETWEMVPGRDKSWLKEMEMLVSPLKSFENIRKEQEAVILGDGGCIPFFGVYLNDLALNATRVPTVERPPIISTSAREAKSTLESSSEMPRTRWNSASEKPDKEFVEPMIDFERYQNAAAIVKTVLRLVESSKHYQFDINPKLVSRCLWICALGDEEIRARQRAMLM